MTLAAEAFRRRSPTRSFGREPGDVETAKAQPRRCPERARPTHHDGSSSFPFRAGGLWPLRGGRPGCSRLGDLLEPRFDRAFRGEPMHVATAFYVTKESNALDTEKQPTCDEKPLSE